MIQVNKIIPQTVELFNPDNISMGFVNQYELFDIAVQIKQHKAIGYYVVFNNEKLEITEEGRIYCTTKGFFDTIANYLRQLI